MIELDPHSAEHLTSYQGVPMTTTTCTHQIDGYEIEVTRNGSGASCQAVDFDVPPVELFTSVIEGRGTGVNWSALGSVHPSIARAYAAAITVAAGLAEAMNRENEQ